MCVTSGSVRYLAIDINSILYFLGPDIYIFVRAIHIAVFSALSNSNISPRKGVSSEAIISSTSPFLHLAQYVIQRPSLSPKKGSSVHDFPHSSTIKTHTVRLSVMEMRLRDWSEVANGKKNMMMQTAMRFASLRFLFNRSVGCFLCSCEKDMAAMQNRAMARPWQ